MRGLQDRRPPVVRQQNVDEGLARGQAPFFAGPLPDKTTIERNMLVRIDVTLSEFCK
jgi:hypothetical protein